MLLWTCGSCGSDCVPCLNFEPFSLYFFFWKMDCWWIISLLCTCMLH